MRLDGKMALITGGGTGIGKAVAERFVAEGAKVCITGRRKELLDKVAASLPEGTVVAFVGDVSKREDVAGMIEAAVNFGGRLDILVNNAAIDQAPASVVDIDPDVWEKVLKTNMTGPMLLMKGAVPHMMRAGGGSIINIASLAGIRCIPNMPSYCASKGGLIMLSQQVALDFGPHRVRSNVICPGAVRTEMLEAGMSHFTAKLGTDVDGVLARFQKDVPLRRVSAPREIAAMCAYLASDDASFVTGTVIPVDGGGAIVDVSGAAITAIVEG
jgi:meso-butanediol dehydrogenase / (S,S)-butanediol dehydrogenase / diacetyl reductase